MSKFSESSLYLNARPEMFWEESIRLHRFQKDEGQRRHRPNLNSRCKFARSTAKHFVRANDSYLLPSRG